VNDTGQMGRMNARPAQREEEFKACPVEITHGKGGGTINGGEPERTPGGGNKEGMLPGSLLKVCQNKIWK